jgi:glucose/arabinose dehydrogenase
MKRALILGVCLALTACSSKEPAKQQPAPAVTPPAATAPAPTAPATIPPTAPAATPTGVAGTWVTDGGATKLVFAPDGTFVMDTRKGQHVTGTYELKGERVKMTGSGEGAISGTFSGTMKGSTFELQFGPKLAVFERQ